MEVVQRGCLLYCILRLLSKEFIVYCIWRLRKEVIIHIVFLYMEVVERGHWLYCIWRLWIMKIGHWYIV